MKSALYFSAAAVAACLRSKCRLQWLRRKEHHRYTIYTSIVLIQYIFIRIYRSSRTNALLCVLSMFPFCPSLCPYLLLHSKSWHRMVAERKWRFNRFQLIDILPLHAPLFIIFCHRRRLCRHQCVSLFSRFSEDAVARFSTQYPMAWVGYRRQLLGVLLPRQSLIFGRRLQTNYKTHRKVDPLIMPAHFRFIIRAAVG